MIDRKNYSLPGYVDDARQNLEDFKYSQPIGGASFVNYPTSSTNTFDYSIGLSVSTRAFRVTFAHDEPDKYNIVDMSHFIRVDNSDVMSSPYIQATSAFITTRVVTEEPIHGQTSWIIDTTNLDRDGSFNIIPHTVFFKFFFSGTVSGTFSFTAL